MTVRIDDTGPGVPAEHLPHIFERFYRADSSRSGSGGSGLGLAIAQAIAEAHDGRIHARNRSGGGASFQLEVPLGD